MNYCLVHQLHVCNNLTLLVTNYIIMGMKVYLDNAATTKMSREVKKAMLPFFDTIYGNQSSSHSFGMEANFYVQQAREQFANVLNCRTNEIYFTSSGSESNSWAIVGLAMANKEKGNHIITSKIEHDSILNACAYLENLGFKVTYLDVNELGEVNLEQLEKAITPQTILISIMMANNEVGTKQDIKKISQIAHDKNIIFHTDAVQTFGLEKIDVNKMGIDALSASSHKIYGPKGMGLLYLKSGIKIDNLIFGGNQEFGKRGGTLNTAGVVGFAKATEISYKNLEKTQKYLKNLQNYLIFRLKNEFSNKIEINGNPQNCMPQIVSVSFLNQDANILLIELDQAKIAVSRGSACTAGSNLPSYVLQAMGKQKQANSTIRFSLGKYTRKKDIDYVIKVLKNIIK